MSAYIVEDMTINRIVTFINGLRHQRQAPLCYLNKLGAKWYCEGMKDHEAAEADRKLAQEMLAMNCDAVSACYSGHPKQEPYQVKLPGLRQIDLLPIQVLKSLDCFLYQCSEGDIIERELFKALSTIKDRLGSALIRETQEYNQAAWA